MDTEEAFEVFWKVKPKREGPNPKKDAKLKFVRLVAKGHDPQTIISAAKAWAVADDKATRFVPMAITWLNQERFSEYQTASKVPNTPDRMQARGQWWVWNGEKWVTEATTE